MHDCSNKQINTNSNQSEYSEEFSQKRNKSPVKSKVKFFTKIELKKVSDVPKFWESEYSGQFLGSPKVFTKKEPVLSNRPNLYQKEAVEDIQAENTSAAKLLDIYLTQSQLTHRYFPESEQRSPVNMKNIVTCYDVMKFPKAKGFGPKITPNIEPKPLKNHRTIRAIHYPPKHVPRGLITETMAKYQTPVKISPLTTKQLTLPTGYKTTYDLPNQFQSETAYCFGSKGKSPQKIVA